MRNISGQYRELLEGKMSQSQFLRNARMMFPDLVSNQNSFEDSVKILKQRGMLTEGDAVKGTPDKSPEYSSPTPDVNTKYKKVEQSPEIDEQDGIYPATTLTDIPKVKANKKVKNTSDGLEEIKPNDTKNELKKVKVLNENEDSTPKRKTNFDYKSTFKDIVIKTNTSRRENFDNLKQEWLDRLNKSEINPITKKSMIDSINAIKKLEDLQKFASYGLLKYEKMGIKEDVDKVTRFDVTLKNGKHFSGVKFINKNSFETPNGGSYINQEIEKVTPTDSKLNEDALPDSAARGLDNIVNTIKKIASKSPTVLQKIKAVLDDVGTAAGDALRTENEDILGDTGKSITDFDVIEDINLTPNFSLSIVFVDGYYKALIVNNNDNTIVKTFKEARNEHNLYDMLKQSGVETNHKFPDEDGEDDNDEFYESLNEDRFDDIVKRALETDDFAELKSFAKEKANIVKDKIKNMPDGLRRTLAKHFNIPLKEDALPDSAARGLDNIVTKIKQLKDKSPELARKLKAVLDNLGTAAGDALRTENISNKNKNIQEKLDKVITKLIKEVLEEQKIKK